MADMAPGLDQHGLVSFKILLPTVATLLSNLSCSLFTLEERLMTERYEIAHSDGPHILIFRAGEWDNVPFEIRLLRPWYGSQFLDSVDLTQQQCLDIARGGYSIAETQPTELEKHARIHARVGNGRGARQTRTLSRGKSVPSPRSTAPRLRLIARGQSSGKSGGDQMRPSPATAPQVRRPRASWGLRPGEVLSSISKVHERRG